MSWRFSQDPNLQNAEIVIVDEQTPRRLVAVVGAGPAGLFAARHLAGEGARVILLNRDIKPGGLAEYGIYPEKHRMKEGLRQQFRQVLQNSEIEYYGNVEVGQSGDLRLEELHELGVQAVLVTVGAQGTKWLGLPGEDLRGVYHAKDIVYHYNRLPPYSEHHFDIGRRVAVVGVGNVMLDIVHWLVQECRVEEVIAVARRGPAEVKFTRTELEYVVSNLDREAYEAELARVTPLMLQLGQDPSEPRAQVEAAQARAVETGCNCARFSLRFLASPVRILGGRDGRVSGLEVENTTMVAVEGGEPRSRGLGTYDCLDVDTVIFAIGDRVDEQFGLPVAGNEFVKNPNPLYPVEGASYEVFDPAAGHPVEGVFVAGWSRKASTGLVGVARKDGIHGAKAVAQYLNDKPAPDPSALQRLRQRLASLNKPVVTRAELIHLEELERAKAAELELEEYKFTSNAAMLTAMGLTIQE